MCTRFKPFSNRDGLPPLSPQIARAEFTRCERIFDIPPKVLLGVQTQRFNTHIPEQDLIADMLLVAYLDAIHPTGKHPERTQADALLWIGDDTEKPWGFLWCCELVEIDPRKFREIVKG